MFQALSNDLLTTTTHRQQHELTNNTIRLEGPKIDVNYITGKNRCKLHQAVSIAAIELQLGPIICYIRLNWLYDILNLFTWQDLL